MKHSFLSRLIEVFLQGNLAILMIIISLAAGAVALLATPREEEPQIVVPLADVLVSYPGGSAEEVEKMVSSRLERLLYQIDGVEYVYSMSRPGAAVVTVRFYVGQDREKSLLKLYNKIFQNIDRTTPGIAGWVIKPIEIDDVPIINVTLFGKDLDEYQLHRISEEMVDKLQRLPNTARISLHGGKKRIVQVQLDLDRLTAYDLSPMETAGALKAANAQMESGSFEKDNRQFVVETGPFLHDINELKNLLISVHDGRPVYLRDVASITDGPEEIQTYSRIGFGAGYKNGPTWTKLQDDFPAVTIAIAKKKGSNAVIVARDVEKMVKELQGKVIPDNVHWRITRNYGQTANDKVNSLVEGLLIAIITVIGLVTLTMNWRVGLIVVIAVPITYSLTLFFNLLFGYTINRVTLFALILSLGLLVDDPIVGVENIHRHLVSRKEPRLKAILSAMNEVLPPIVVATLAIIVAFLPMFFITGMMGPYMRPMAINVPLAMIISLLVSVTITPWLSKILLRDKENGQGHHADASPGNDQPSFLASMYRRIVGPLLDSRQKAIRLLLIILGLFVLSLLLAGTGLVPLKTLPFDNKNEFQIVVDMPAPSSLEKTAAVVQELENYLRTQPEVVNYVSTIGSASPMDFNGMVRHYYLRQGPNVADIRVNLLPKGKRKLDSHSIVLRIRSDIAKIAEHTGANLKLVEVPPGPPVFSTIVAEIYGQPFHTYDDLIAAAKIVEGQMKKEKGVVDVDNSVEADSALLFFRVDREKAGLNGVSTEDIVQTMRLALGGLPAGTLHVPSEQNELPILLQLPREKRSDAARLKSISVKSRNGKSVQLGELGTFEERTYDKTILHKNQERVVLATAEVAGRGPAYAVLNLSSYFNRHPLPQGIRVNWAGEGEWKITIDVFRDLGIAFAAALMGIYVLLVYETGSFVLPVVIMLSIPLTMIGIMPGFWLLNLFVDRPIGGFDNPVYFTATAMIGMIALAGIVVRNGIILVDFINKSVAKGTPLREAILQSGAVRFRPIFLTAGAAMLGAWPITLDPIFSGLAWALIFGLFVSTAFTLVVIPVVYDLLYKKEN